MPEPLVSVVIPCHNAGSFIEEAIGSALRQTYPRVEVIVVDDASTDDSWTRVREYGDSVRAERNSNRRGACHSRNRGTSLANGELIMFLDADDFMAPDTVRALANALAVTDGGLAVCDWRYLVEGDDGWSVLNPETGESPPESDYIRGWLGDSWFPTCAVMWRRAVLESVGGWDETLAANQDGDLVLRALFSGVTISRARGGMGTYRRHSAGTLSSSTSVEAIASRRRVLEWVEKALEARGALFRYRIELGRSYYWLARIGYLVDSGAARACEERAWQLAGRHAVTGPPSHRVAAGLLGLQRKERLSAWLRARSLRK